MSRLPRGFALLLVPLVSSIVQPAAAHSLASQQAASRQSAAEQAVAQQKKTPPTAVVPAIIAEPAEKTAASKTEADRRYDAIMTDARKTRNREKTFAELERFIRENPTFPRLETAYSNLLTIAGTSRANAEKVLILADGMLAKFTKPSSRTRAMALRAKFSALRTLRRDEAIKELAAKVLETETSPAVLQDAAQADRSSSLKLLEKAIAERSRNADASGSPSLDSLKWDYAQSLIRGGREEEALKLGREVVEEARKEIARLETLAKDDTRRRRATSLYRQLRVRCQLLSERLSRSGHYEEALEYLTMAGQSSESVLGDSSWFETSRAAIYAKMRKPDLELECYVRALAARINVETRDKLVELARANGVALAELYERARTIRRERARAIPGFELKTPEGTVVTLDSLRSKVTLVNFFFPT